MSIWTGFEDSDLFEILDCENMDEVKRRIHRRFDQSQWIAAARSTYTLVRRKYMSLSSTFNSINHAATFSMLVLLAVIGSITVAYFPLTIMAGVLSVIGMAAGIFYTVAASLLHKRKVDEKIAKLDFNAIKILCADEITKRKRMQLASYNLHHNIPVFVPPNSNLAEPQFSFEMQKKLSHIRRGTTFGLIAFASLFATYYCGLAIAFNAFGLLALSGAMLGPIGMAVALAVSIGVGAYFGYQHYKACVRKEKTEQFLEFQGQQIKDKTRDCRALAKQVKHLTSPSSCVRRQVSTPLFYERRQLSGTLEKVESAELRSLKKV